MTSDTPSTRPSSLIQFVLRWWNWWRLPRFKNDAEAAEWFENVDPRRLYLPPANGVAVSEDLKVTLSWDKREVAK